MPNPVPSDLISDGKLNFESLDFIVNSDQPFATTRIGKTVYTWEGLTAEILSSGNLLWPPIAYTAGLEVTTSRQTYSYDSGTGLVVYNWVGDLPFTTTGNFESEDGWNVIQRYFTASTIIEKFTVQNAIDNSGVLTLQNIEYTPGDNQIFVNRNGSKLALTDDYTESSSSTVTLTQSFLDADYVQPDDEIEVYTTQILPEAIRTLPDAYKIDYSGLVDGALNVGVALDTTWTQVQQNTDDLVDVGVALDTTNDNIQKNVDSLVDLRSHTTDYKVHDAVFSWWAKPMLLRYAENGYNRTYQTFAQSDGAGGVIVHDHITGSTERYILDTDRTPDDHNAGCVQVGDGKVVVVIGGRSNTAAPVDQCLVCEWDIDDTPNGNSFSKYYLEIGRDYPNLYQYEDDAFLLVSQRGAGGLLTGHAFRLNSWPLDSGWGPITQLTDNQNSAEWMYITSRRNADSPNIIDLAIGFHPEFQPLANIYKAQIRHVGGSQPWRLFVTGSEIANLHTGAGLPVTESDFELAYSAGANEKTRLYDVKGDAVVFTSYFNDDTANSVYKYAYKSGSSWAVVTVGDCGAPFLDSSAYFGGAAISENGGFITASVNVNGYTRIVEFGSSGGGSSWFELQNYTFADKTGANIIHGRTMAEVPALATLQNGYSVSYQMVAWAGRYSPSSFTDYQTTIISLNPRPTKWTPAIWEQNGAALSSKGTDMSGDFQASIASSGGEIKERVRQASIASSGGSIRTRNTAMLGSRNMTFTGVVGSGQQLTDNWVMGSIGANESTVAKNYSALIGCDQCSLDVPNSLGNRLNVGAASESCNATANSSFAFFAASRGATITGNFGVVIGSDNCNIGSGTANFGAAGVYSSIDSDANNSRSVVLGSSGSTAGQAGAAVIASTNSQSTHQRSVAIASDGVASAKDNALFGGVGTGTSTANRTWEIDSTTGNMEIAGQLTSSHTFADIAKMIENGEGTEIEPGYLLTLIGDKVYKAQAGERIDAIVAATPAIVHNDTPITWQGRYLRDEWGRKVTEPVEMVRFIERDYVAFEPGLYAEGVQDGYWNEYEREGRVSDFTDIPEDAEYRTVNLPVENPEYDDTIQNIPRSERPDEWVKAGVHGLLLARVDSTVTQSVLDAAHSSRENCYLAAGDDGIGTLADSETNVQIMSVDNGIAKVILR